MLLKI